MKHFAPDLESALRVAATMPSLRHFHPGRKFSISESDAARWLCEREEVMQWAWNVLKRHGVISLDVETGRWQGVACKDSVAV